MSNHLSKHHKEVWEAYSETRSRVATVATKAKEEEKAACEMENSEVRFYDVRSRKGRLPFLKKVNCCEMHFSLISIVLFAPQMKWRILSMDSSTLTSRTQPVSSKAIA